MPLIKLSSYKPPFPFKNVHLNTIYPSLLRKVEVRFTRERIITPDGDFVDVDWIKKDQSKLVILMHGLEGSSESRYIHGMSSKASNSGFDVLVLNFRGCSGTPNKAVRSYHSGETEDINFLISDTLQGRYDKIHLVGFSLGGNVLLKYLGEKAHILDLRISSAVAISPPCELGDCAKEIAKTKNWIYNQRFLSSLKQKVVAKKHITEGIIDYQKVMNSKNFNDFDEYYTAPIHGFASAEAYWYSCSANRCLDKIAIPTLILSALDDTFLSDSCYPYEFAKNSKAVFLETPEFGGHVGFISRSENGTYWSEKRTIEFLLSH